MATDFSLYLRRSFRAVDGLFACHAGQAGGRDCQHGPQASTIATGISRSCWRRSSAAFWPRAALPIEFPTVSLGEVFLSPTSLKFRNLMSIDTEEMIGAQPMDAVV